MEKSRENIISFRGTEEDAAQPKHGRFQILSGKHPTENLVIQKQGRERICLAKQMERKSDCKAQIHSN
jgi:hypothetical protein